MSWRGELQRVGVGWTVWSGWVSGVQQEQGQQWGEGAHDLRAKQELDLGQIEGGFENLGREVDKVD